MGSDIIRADSTPEAYDPRMAAVTFDVRYVEERNRITTLLRYFLAIPHMIVSGLWGIGAVLGTLAQWFVIIFTGQRNEGIWRFQRSYLGYAERVNAYYSLTYDTYPAFGAAWGDEPVAFGLAYEAQADRLTNALRVLWIIPAAIINYFINLASGLLVLFSWVAIVFTGKQPRGLFDFTVRALRLSAELAAYGLLMTDDYPKFRGGDPTSVLPPGDQQALGGGSGAAFPPPQGPSYG